MKQAPIIVSVLHRRQPSFLKIEPQLCQPQKHSFSAIGLRMKQERAMVEWLKP
jgi:hypothetical protein